LVKAGRFSRIENVQRIERPLDGEHGAEHRLAVFVGEIFILP